MSPSSRNNAPLIAISGVGAVLAVVALMATGPSEEPATGPATTPLVASERPSTNIADDSRYLVPVTNTQPAKGPVDALVTVVVWCHLRDEDCAAVDGMMSRVQEAHPGKVRWVFRHLLNAERRDSRLVHAFTQAAHRMGERFWEARARVQALPTEEVEAAQLVSMCEELELDANRVAGALQTGAFDRHLGADMRMAEAFGVHEAPGIFVNGRPLGDAESGARERALNALVNAELESAERLVASGVQASEVYASLTEDGKWSVDDDPVSRRAQDEAREAEPASR